ncbi:MAG TPA: Wzz/FepE/Etk N-terminal domain-containing protein, partial [Candidatus Eisenbacteria bacterium]|nr:Wzz/FepE/Etk N-terminal domain-containing protein [Candidatus Eisenbacteria bacterium]
MDNGPEKNFSKEDPTPIDWSEYWRLFLANFWIVVSITGIVFLGALLYYSSRPNVYTADVQILVERVENLPRSSQELVTTPAFQGEEDYYGTQIAILTGRKVRERVASELPDIPPYQVAARRLIKTRIISLWVNQRDPVWAARIANKFAQVYLSASNEEQLFIGKQILNMIPEEKPSMDSEEAALLKDTDSMEEMAKFNKKEYAESLLAITNDPIIQRLRNQKLDIESGMAELMQRYK